ncbi:LacI family DNA-binding transcriptional regulator [Terrabacter sp. GCM10028922]|uniref:LacI family DNA-binding transcriptional regulator n=1 Tax=Terrabacter sp. GCM10028922 TaxID=3273428 RepID=UPI0036138E10
MSTEHDDARPVTIYTVAERAGVSIATVSRVLSGSTPASAITRQRVLRAVEDLEYVPLRAGRAVDVPSHETHGLVLPGLRGPYYSELLSGFEVTAAQAGQSTVVVVCDASKDAEAAVRKILGRVDGIVIANDTVSDSMVRQIVRSTPTVLVARDAIEGCDSVQVENFISSADLTRHLLEHGRRRLVFVGDPDASHDISERYRGFLHALTHQRGAEVAEPIRVEYEETSARRVMDGLRHAEASGADIDGIVCANDELALATMVLLGREGLRVPDDVAVVGFDDIMTSRYLAPGLTTVQQPMRELGRWAAIRLHERIAGRTFDVHPQVLPTRLVVRGSCGCDWDQTSVVGA